MMHKGIAMDLIPIKLTVEMSQDDGHLHEFDVIIGYVFRNRTRTLQKIIEEGDKGWEVIRATRGQSYFYNRIKEPKADNDNTVVE